MSDGYWVIIGEEYSQGVNMVEPKLLPLGIDCFGNPSYWSQWNRTDEEIIDTHGLDRFDTYKIVR